MTRAEFRVLVGYSEKHHVIPRCLDKTSKRIVRLTPEEHYVAHQLLVKMYPGNNKLILAATKMTSSTQHVRRNNRLYGWLRRAFAASMRGNTRSLGVKHSTEAKAARVASLLNSDAWRAANAQRRGIKKPPMPIEVRQTISNSLKGKLSSAQANAQKARRGRPLSEAQRAGYKKRVFPEWSAEKRQAYAMRCKARTGMPSPSKGRPWSEARRAAQFMKGSSQ